MENITPTKLKRIAQLSDIKILTEQAKNLICEIEKSNYNKVVLCDNEQTNILINGYLGKTKTEHHKSSFLYAIARVLSVLGYAKKPTGKTKTLIEDIKRVKLNSDLNLISLDFTDKHNFK